MAGCSDRLTGTACCWIVTAKTVVTGAELKTSGAYNERNHQFSRQTASSAGSLYLAEGLEGVVADVWFEQPPVPETFEEAYGNALQYMTADQIARQRQQDEARKAAAPVGTYRIRFDNGFMLSELGEGELAGA